MDESWRMCMGIPAAHHLPRRKSMENTLFSMSHVSMVGDNTCTLDVDDFSDVFGGPPRSVLCRKLSGDFIRSSFYEEVFRPPEFISSQVTKGGRSLPAFRIPARSGGFYSDIFGSDDALQRSRERSRSNSSSVLSSEELSPLRPVVGDDVGLSSFASKLRPINVPCRWNSTMMPDQELPKQQQQQGMPAFPSSRSSYNENLYMENEYNNGDNLRNSYYGYCRRASSPEIISLEPHSFRSVKISADDLESPSSPASSLCQEPEPRAGGVGGDDSMQEEDEDEDDDDDEVMSSYVIEINSDHREGTGEAVSIDEAIAWAKERYNTQSSERELEKDQQPVKTEASSGHFGRQTNGNGIVGSETEVEQMKSKAAAAEEEEEEERSEEQIKMEVLDEDVRLWSYGKENNIRLLLSTLHHILWPNSGWHMISLTSLKESSQVKKAYQKARLCLHPDKLQQRGATVSQKYVADKAFTILQDAWAAFISQDVFFS